jgi:hypothetical protein
LIFSPRLIVPSIPSQPLFSSFILVFN